MTTPRLGEYLRGAREKAGLSLEQLAERTRVRLENLAALEREELEALPADTYVRGFVKIVCRELRLPPEEGLALYSNLRSNSGLPEEIVWAEVDTNTEPGALEKALQDPERVLNFARRAKRIAIPAAVALVGALGFLLVRAVGSGGDGRVPATSASAAPGSAPRGAQDLAAKPADEAAAGVAESAGEGAQGPPPARPGAAPGESPREASGRSPAAAPPPEPAPRPATPAPPPDAGTDPRGDGEQAAADPPAAPAEGGGDIVHSATGRAPVSEAAAADTASPAPALSASSPADPSPVVKGPIVLEVEALREAEVTLVLDGTGFPRKRSLMAGERKSWKADSVFVLSASDGGAIRLRLDGADLGSAGDDGQVVTNLHVRK